ncbi:hypothetical protein AB1Y20_003423 [Prymnesium parvum]|uniref:NudC domain-containing protein 1 n=1 Tax=Prymnesium parvum TaxID=97485 RepID=A0AB34JDQ9_PRYPA
MAAPGLGEFLQRYDLAELGPRLIDKLSIREMQGLLAANRPFFLERLRQAGIEKLIDRQKLANALSRAQKEGSLPPPPAMPHMNPCYFAETTDQLTVWLSVEAGIKAHQISFSVDANSIQVKVMGEETSLSGRLCGLVKPRECTWEIERTAQPAYDPLLAAADQPPQLPDKVAVCLLKSTPEKWVTLFKDGVAKRVAETNPVLEARKRREELRREEEKKAGPMDWTNLNPKPRPDPGRAAEVQAIKKVRAQRFSEKLSSTPSLDAANHWIGSRAMLIWRDGASSIEGRPGGPEGEPLFTWTESKSELICRARTRSGLCSSDVKLTAGLHSADVHVGGAQTIWCGRTVGRLSPSACKVRVLQPPQAPWTTLELTLHKAEPRLWRAPYLELLAEVDVREAKASLPTRDQLALNGWDYADSERDVLVKVPIKDCGHMSEDDFRLAVAHDSFNLHVLGQEEKPLLAGETSGMLVPEGCRWSFSQPWVEGTQKFFNIELSLRKRDAGYWHKDLLKRAFQ